MRDGGRREYPVDVPECLDFSRQRQISVVEIPNRPEALTGGKRQGDQPKRPEQPETWCLSHDPHSEVWHQLNADGFKEECARPEYGFKGEESGGT
jgi:hypothetical protein